VNRTQVLPNFILDSSIEDLPAEVIETAKKCLSDWIRIRGLMKKINVIRNESLGESEARIRVKLKNEIQYSHHVVAPKGDPRNPLSFEEIIKKFEDLTCTVLSRRRMNRMIDIIQNLEKLQNLSELIRLCCVDRDLLRRVKT